MIKSTKEFDSIVYEILTNLRDSDSFRSYVEKQEQSTDFEDILEHCVKNRYIDGLPIDRSADNVLMISFDNPRLTPKGFQFIENYSI